MNNELNLKSRNPKRPKVLIIEDQVAAMLPIKTVLEHLGAIIEVSYEVDDAESIFEKFKPDFVVLDWHLGDRWGWEFLNTVELTSKLIKRAPIKLITYSGQKNLDLETCIYPSVAHICHIPKPIDILELTKQSARFLKMFARN